jgi:type II secretory pathway component HofQ
MLESKPQQRIFVMFSSFFLFLTLQMAFAHEKGGDSGVIIRLGGEVVPADQLQTPKITHTGTPISLDVINADIHGLIRMFSEHSGVNFIIAEDVQGKVSARVDDIPWDQAFVAILSSQGLIAVNFGDIIVIQNRD